MKTKKYYLKSFFKYVLNESLYKSKYNEFGVIDATLNVVLENFRTLNTEKNYINYQLEEILNEAYKSNMSDDDFIDKVKNMDSIDDIKSALNDRTRAEIISNKEMNDQLVDTIEKIKTDVEDKVISGELDKDKKDSKINKLEESVREIYLDNLNEYGKIVVEFSKEVISNNIEGFQENLVINKNLVKDVSTRIYAINELARMLEIK